LVLETKDLYTYTPYNVIDMVLTTLTSTVLALGDVEQQRQEPEQ
jgi:hypothetical protein